MQAEQHKRLL